MRMRFTPFFLIILIANCFNITAQTDPKVSISDHNNNIGKIDIDCSYNFVPSKKIELTASFPDLKSSTDYTVSPIPFNQIGNFADGSIITFTKDDSWSSSIAIGFPFCFYGSTYSTLNVADNGIVRFGYNPLNTESSFASITTPTPSPSLVKNAIFGGFQDLINAQNFLGCAIGDNCGTITSFLTGTCRVSQRY